MKRPPKASVHWIGWLLIMACIAVAILVLVLAK